MIKSLRTCIYGRRIYEIMRYWDQDDPAWSVQEQEFAAAWRKCHKVVVSRGTPSVGANAELLTGDLKTAVRALKNDHKGDIAVAGPNLAASLSELGLIDEYRLYYHPVVLGNGAPFFAGKCPPLALVESLRIGADVVRLTYVKR